MTDQAVVSANSVYVGTYLGVGVMDMRNNSGLNCNQTVVGGYRGGTATLTVQDSAAINCVLSDIGDALYTDNLTRSYGTLTVTDEREVTCSDRYPSDATPHSASLR